MPFRAVMETPDFLPIEFVVVGASVCGLSCAIALKRAGHKVTLYDYVDPFKPTTIDSSSRLPPNATKLFYRWGMEEALKQFSIKSTGTMFAQSEHSDLLFGTQEWEESVLEETGGDFLLIHQTNLRKVLAEHARELGACFRYPAKVASVKADPDRPSVTLEDGEVVEADVVLLTDGQVFEHFGREYMIEAWEEEDDAHLTGVQLFNVLLPGDSLDVIDDKELVSQLTDKAKVFTWFSKDIGALGYQIKAPSGEKLFALLIYTLKTKEGHVARMTDADELLESLGKDADPRLLALARTAVKVSVLPLYYRSPLEEWVHPDGRVMCLGESAHPQALGSLYTFGMAAGDGAFLGRIFSHLHERSQIDTFLTATQESRQPRVEHVLKATAGNVFAVALPPAIAATYDQSLRRRTDRATKAASSLAHQAAQSPAERAEHNRQMIQMIEDIFGHDPEDAADDWWVEWGLLQESATRWNLHVQEQDEQAE